MILVDFLIHCIVYDHIQEYETLDDVSDAFISTGMYTIFCALFSYYSTVLKVCWIKPWIDLGLRHAGKFQPKLRVKKGKENSNIHHSEVESTTFSQTADIDESSLCAFQPGDVHDHISPTFGDSIAADPTPNVQQNAESLAETTQLDENGFGDAAHSEGVCGKVTVLNYNT